MSRRGRHFRVRFLRGANPTSVRGKGVSSEEATHGWGCGGYSFQIRIIKNVKERIEISGRCIEGRKGQDSQGWQEGVEERREEPKQRVANEAEDREGQLPEGYRVGDEIALDGEDAGGVRVEAQEDVSQTDDFLLRGLLHP